MAKTVFGIPGADAKQQKGGAVAPKGVSGVAAPSKAMPQKAGNVAPQRPAPAVPNAPTDAPPPAVGAPQEPQAPEADLNAPVDVQGKTVFGMPAMKIPMQEPAPQPGMARKVADTQPDSPPPENAILDPEELITLEAEDDHPTAEVKAVTPEMLGEEMPSATLQVSPPNEATYAAKDSKGWLWVLIVVGALAIAGGGALLVMQMLGKLDTSDVEIPELTAPE